MKRCLSILVVLALALKLSADETNRFELPKISASESAKHYGQEVIVTGIVVHVSIHPKVVQIDLDKPYPKTPMSVTIFSEATNHFENLSTLEGKSVEISGKIEPNFHTQKPELFLDNSNQLKVIAPAH
jgi:hypothetical protein